MMDDNSKWQIYMLLPDRYYIKLDPQDNWQLVSPDSDPITADDQPYCLGRGDRFAAIREAVLYLNDIGRINLSEDQLSILYE